MNKDSQTYERISAFLIEKTEAILTQRAPIGEKLASFSLVADGNVSNLHTAIQLDLQIATWRELETILTSNGESGIAQTLHDITKQIEWEQEQHLKAVRIPASTDALSNAIEAKQLEFMPRRWKIMREFVDNCGRIMQEGSQERKALRSALAAARRRTL